MIKAIILLFLCVCVLPSGVSTDRRLRDSLIIEYFLDGYPYQLILCFLALLHGFSLSLRQLKRILRRLNLRRRPSHRGTPRVLEALIRDELQRSGSLLGYRALWHRLRRNYLIPISRDSVMRALSQVDPHGSRQRQQRRLTRRQYISKGPNYVWHCDGMDKLKRFGIAIHGCIDGYSRKVLWLKAAKSNNNPRTIAYYYLEYVKQLQGVPRILRSDCGTENTHIAFLQPYLRRNHADCFSGSASFRYGKSVSNQRIEAWWSQLKRWCTQWWHDFFLEMQEQGLYNETVFYHVDCLRLCFQHLVQEDLDKVREEWNSHRMRTTRSSSCPPGYPNELYFLPEILGAQDYVCDIDSRDIPTASEYAEIPDPPASLEFLQMALMLMNEQCLTMPSTIPEALNLYVTLITVIEAECE